MAWAWLPVLISVPVHKSSSLQGGMQNLCSTFQTSTEEQATACNRQHPSQCQKNLLPDTLVKTKVKRLITNPVLYLYYLLKLTLCWKRHHCILAPIFPVSNLHSLMLCASKHSYTKSTGLLLGKEIPCKRSSDGCLYAVCLEKQIYIPW